MSLKDLIENSKNSDYYKDYQNIVQELNTYRDLHPMTDEEGNIMRHRGGSARMIQKRGFLPTNFYGAGKEYEDYFLKHKNGYDSLGDLKNNFYGSLIGLPLKQLPADDLYGYILQGIRGEWK